MVGIVGLGRGGVAAVSAGALIRYHLHAGSRFPNDGVFLDDKMPLQYFFDPAKKEEIVANAKEGWQLAKLAYEPKDNERYEILKDKNGNPMRVTDKWSLDATAFRDKLSGKIVLAIAGIETKHADGKADTALDVLLAFDSTAGLVSKSMPALIEFSKKIVAEHGPIEVISGHSLGGYEGMQLKIIADKQNLTSTNCQLYTFDMAGMTHGLAKNLENQFGITQDDITRSLHNNNVYSVANDLNSFNTLGAQPGNFITATAPAQSKYEEHKINHLLPKRHNLPFFEESFKKGEWFEGHNNGHARGPEYLTGFTMAGLTGAFHPLGYAITAAPIGRDLAGRLDDVLFEPNKDMAHLLDPKVIDGLRPKNGEAPKMEAYTHLNILYKDCYLQKYSELKDLPNEERVAAAKKFAQNPENLKTFIENRVLEWRAEQEKLSDDKPWYQAAPELLWNARNKLQNNGNIPVDLPERLAREAEAALAELTKYAKDFEDYAKSSEQLDIAVAANKLPLPTQGAAQRN